MTDLKSFRLKFWLNNFECLEQNLDDSFKII